MTNVNNISNNQMDPLDDISSDGKQSTWDQYDAAFRAAMFRELDDELKSLQQAHKESEQRNKEIMQGSLN